MNDTTYSFLFRIFGENVFFNSISFVFKRFRKWHCCKWYLWSFVIRVTKLHCTSKRRGILCDCWRQLWQLWIRICDLLKSLSPIYFVKIRLPDLFLQWIPHKNVPSTPTPSMHHFIICGKNLNFCHPAQ